MVPGRLLACGICLMMASCSYRVMELSSRPRVARYLLPPHPGKGRLLQALTYNKRPTDDYYTIKLKFADGITQMPVGSPAAASKDFHLYEDFLPSDHAFFIYARKRWLSKKYDLFLVIHYNYLLSPAPAGSPTAWEVDYIKLSDLTDDIRQQLYLLGAGVHFSDVHGGDAGAFQLNGNLYSYDILDRLFRHLSLPLEDGLAQYSYRTGSFRTYNDLLPGMYLRVETAAYNPFTPLPGFDPPNKSFVSITRPDPVHLNFNAWRYTGVPAPLPNNPADPAYNAAGIVPIVNVPVGGNYLGLSIPSTHRLTGLCPVGELGPRCNDFLVSSPDFIYYRTTLMPGYYGEPPLLERPNPPTCSNGGGGCLLPYNNTAPSATNNILYYVYLSITRDKDHHHDCVELGTTADSVCPHPRCHLFRRYENHVLRIHGNTDLVMISLYDQITPQ